MNNDELRVIVRQLLNQYAREQLQNGYKVTTVHFYKDLNGVLLYFRIRLKNDIGEKWIRPFHYCKVENKWKMSEPEFEKGKSLYGLEYFNQHSQQSIYIVEGENKVDALRKLGIIAVTSGSSSSANGANWEDLRGSNIIIWPDNDNAGIRYAETVTNMLRSIGCNVKWVDISGLNLPDGGDVIDLIDENKNTKASDILAIPTIGPQFKKEEQEPDSKISYRIASNIQIKPIDWLWLQRFAKGKLAIISGDPGTGKSQITAYMASVITSKGKWTDDSKCDLGNIIFLSAEDSPEDTIVPRLTASGANLSKVAIIDSVKQVDPNGNEGERLFDINADLAELEKTIATIGDVSAIFIDPITAYVGDLDDSKNTRVRSVLAPLAKLAEKYNVAIICISHNNKNEKQSAIYRVSGSIAYIAACRIAYLVFKDPEDHSKCYFMPIKSNIGKDDSGFSYRLAEHDLGNAILTSKIVWDPGVVTSSVSELIGAHNDPDKSNVIEDAKEFLTGLLANGPVETQAIFAAAEKEKLSQSSIRRAKEKLKIIALKKKGTQFAPWYWCFKEHESQLEQVGEPVS